MNMHLDSALTALVSRQQLGVLATLKRDGRPQLSHVTYTWDEDTASARMSVTDDRAKVRNLRRDPRGSLFVRSDDGWAYTVLDGDVELSAVAAAPDDAVVTELIEIYRLVNGEHPDWTEFRAAMVSDKRLVARLRTTHAYGSPQR